VEGRTQSETRSPDNLCTVRASQSHATEIPM
jgi:hypothetical protein